MGFSDVWDAELMRKGYEVRSTYVGEHQQDYMARSSGPLMRRSIWKDGKELAAVEGFGYVTQKNLLEAVAQLEGDTPRPLLVDFGVQVTEEKDEIRVSHPSYAHIQANKYTGGGREFFGSKIAGHMGGVELTISQCDQLFRKGPNGIADGEPRYWGHGRGIIAIRMTIIQWGELMTNMNSQGTCCTIATHPEHGRLSIPDAPFSQAEHIQEQSHKAMKMAVEGLAAKLEELKPQMTGPGPMKATDKQALYGEIQQLVRLVTDTMPFLAKQFDEAIEEALSEARTEFGQYANTVAAQRGLDIEGAQIALPGTGGQ